MNTRDLHNIVREKNRWTLVLYDVLTYVLVFIFLFVFRPSWGADAEGLEGIALLYQALLGASCLFVFRFLLKIYKQVLRYGSISAMATYLSASFFGGSIYVILNRLCVALIPGFVATSVLRGIALIFIDYTVGNALRVTYAYLYQYAQKGGKLSNFFRRFLILSANVDARSKTIAGFVPASDAFKNDEESADPINDLQRIIRHFNLHGRVQKITRNTKGYINQTYCVETLSENNHVHKYLLQRINTNVFHDVDALMDNFLLTTSHLQNNFDLPGKNRRGTIATLKTTKDGKSYLRDDSGCWRMLTYFDNVYSMNLPETPECFYHAGYAFGAFMKKMSEVPLDRVKITIPDFHNTYKRYLALEKSVKNDAVGRATDVQPEIEFIRARRDKFNMINAALESGEIPTRICHNDCNLNNILFDEITKLPVTVIDLDTVMPSSPLFDYGDSMRIGTNTAEDDEKDLSKVHCDLNLYEKYARGYLEAAGDILTTRELELLPYASLVITAEDGIRFLADHIDGDVYYNIFYHGQNLDRSRTQLKLLEDMERKLPEIKEILQKIYDELGLPAMILSKAEETGEE